MFRFQPTTCRPLSLIVRCVLGIALVGAVAVPAWTQLPSSEKANAEKGEGEQLAEDRPQRLRPNQVAGFMRVKLDKAQKVLEGLTVEDYGMIQKASHEMMLMSQATNWQVLQTPQYLERSREFRRAASELTEAAERKNLEAAALAYVDVTLKCVECHKYVRRVRAE